MSDGEAFVKVHGVCDGVEALEGDDCEGEDGEFAGENAEEPGHQTPRRRLPLDRVLLKLPCKHEIHGKGKFTSTDCSNTLQCFDIPIGAG